MEGIADRIEHNRRVAQRHLFETRAKITARAKGAKLAPGSLQVPIIRKNPDQNYLLNKAEELGPIFKVWLPHKLTTCIVGLETGRRFLVENENRIRAGTLDLSSLFPFGFLRAIEGPPHRKYRRLILDAFRQTPLAHHKQAIRENITHSLHSLVAANQPVASQAIRREMKAATTANFMLLILGVPKNTPMFDDLVNAYNLYAPAGRFLVIRPRHKPGYQAIRNLVAAQIATIEADDNAPPSLLRHLVRSGSADETSIGNMIQMVEATRYDVRDLWCWILKKLSDRPDIVGQARKGQTSGVAGLSFFGAIVRETLRLEQSELLLRVATDDIVFDGYFIPRKSHIRICVWESHHDLKIFDDPFTFDCQRFLDAKIPANDYSPFGLDHHRCPGADWTNDLSEIFTEELVRHFRWGVVADGDPVSGKFHFEPSAEFAINIEAHQ